MVHWRRNTYVSILLTADTVVMDMLFTDYFDQISQEGFVNRNILIHFIRDIILVNELVNMYIVITLVNMIILLPGTCTTSGGLIFS